MRRECKERIKYDAEKLGILVERYKNAVDVNLRMILELMSIWREEGDRRFGWRNFKIDRLGPANDVVEICRKLTFKRCDVNTRREDCRIVSESCNLAT